MKLLQSMSRLQKILMGIIVFLLVVVLSIDISIYRAFYVNPHSIHVTYKTLKSEKIPDSMKRVSMVYVTDLEYGEFRDTEFTQAVFDRINALHPDMFVFGGDLLNWNANISQDDLDKMGAWLSSIEAPLGKFAVYGEQDLYIPDRKTQVDGLYAAAQIEVLDNANLQAGNQSRSGIRLVGLSPTADLEKAFAGTSSEQYNLVFTHYPDNLLSEEMPLKSVGMALAGNAHGTQVTWPIYGGYKQWDGSTSLNRAREKRLSFPYYLSSGTGCIDINARLNAPVEIIYLMFE